MICLRRALSSIRVLADGLRRHASVKRNTSAFFEPHDGGMTAEDLGDSLRLPHAMRGRADDRMVCDFGSYGNGPVPFFYALFELLQIGLSHAKSLTPCPFKRHSPLVPELAGGNA